MPERPNGDVRKIGKVPAYGASPADRGFESLRFQLTDEIPMRGQPGNLAANYRPVPGEKVKDYNMKPVAEIAREMANEFEHECNRHTLTSFADGIFLELPEDRHRLLGQLARIVNEMIENAKADTTAPVWQNVKRIWKAATE